MRLGVRGDKLDSQLHAVARLRDEQGPVVIGIALRTVIKCCRPELEGGPVVTYAPDDGTDGEHDALWTIRGAWLGAASGSMPSGDRQQFRLPRSPICGRPGLGTRRCGCPMAGPSGR